MSADLFVCRNQAGERVYVEARLTVTPGQWQTVEHETVTGPVRVSLSGVVIRKGGSIGRDGDWREAGQIDTTENLRRHLNRDPAWSFADVMRLADVWDRWHLNDMCAACAHQTVVWEDAPYGRQSSLTLTEPCPETGYRYGSSWLVEPAPADVVAWIAERFGLEIPTAGELVR